MRTFLRRYPFDFEGLYLAPARLPSQLHPRLRGWQRAEELCQDFFHVSAFVKSRDNTRDDRDQADGAMSIQASRSSYRGQSKGDAQIKEGRFVVDYRMADHRLYYRQADNA